MSKKSVIAKTGYRLIQKWYFSSTSIHKELLDVKDFTGKKDRRAVNNVA